MNTSNNPAPGNAGIEPRLTIQNHCPGVPEPERSAYRMIVVKLLSTAVLVVMLLGCRAPTHDSRPGVQAQATKGNVMNTVTIPTHDSRPGVQAQGPYEYMFVSSSGSKVGFSALELVQIARRYAETQMVQFQFEATEKTIWIRTDGSPIIADVYFFAALGKPSLHIEIDRDGKVKRHKIETYVCGTGSR